MNKCIRPQIVFVLLAAVAASCNGDGSTIGQETQVGTYSFAILSAKLVDTAERLATEADHSLLAVEARLQNAEGNGTIPQDWSQSIRLKNVGEEEDGARPAYVGDAPSRSGLPTDGTVVLVFQAPKDMFEFCLNFRFPNSEDSMPFDFRADDQRFEHRVDAALKRLAELERMDNTPLVRQTLGWVNHHYPIRYYGDVLVSAKDIPGLLEQIDGLSEEARRAPVGKYILQQEGWTQSGPPTLTWRARIFPPCSGVLEAHSRNGRPSLPIPVP